jgi:hypothetical protein
VPRSPPSAPKRLTLRAARPGLRVTPGERFVLTCIFENTRRLLAKVLERHGDPDGLRDAIETFWSYQIAGLRGLAARLGSARAE